MTSVSPAAATVTSALASLNQTTTLTLANFNVNLALWKREAPIEYQPLGDALSVHRRETAEYGPQHVLALKLGALFDHDLPQAKSLFSAYGNRASEIAIRSNKELGSKSAYGPLYQHAGFDGTSVWAAATTSDSAIAVHLLACMLARQFPDQLAVAAWEEMVQQRKQELRGIAERASFGIDATMASKVEITHNEIKAWDASARAWLATADRVEHSRYTQLRLIFDNLNASVDSNILRAWHNALIVMDKVVSGAGSHLVQTGEVLSAVASWHLFPDLTVLCDIPKAHRFRDELVAQGGHLTVGAREEPEDGNSGIYWSLPLSHLRFYGEVEIVQRSLRIDSSYVTFDRFRYMILGLASWFWTPLGATVKEIATLFIALHKFYSNASTSPVETWPGFLASIASQALRLEGDEEEYARRLIIVGQRWGSKISETPLLSFFNSPAGHGRSLPGLGPLSKDTISKLSMLQLSCDNHFQDQKDHLLIRVKDTRDPRTFKYMAFVANEHKWMLPQPHDNFYLGLTEITDYKAMRQLLGEGTFESENGFILILDKEDNSTIRFIFADPPHRRRRGETLPRPTRLEPYQFIHGDGDVALFSSAQWKLSLPIRLYDLADLQLALAEGLLDPVKLLRYIEPHAALMRAAASCSKVYDDFPSTSVSVNSFIQTPLTKAKWAQAWKPTVTSEYPVQYLAEQLAVPQMNRCQSFACICMLASGSLNLDLTHLTRVMGVSVRDSIYVNKLLLSDPGTDCGERIAHMPGNIGRGGLALMVPPHSLKTPKQNMDNWRVMNFAPFDGKREDHYGSSTAHLWFTDFESSIDTNQSGEKFVSCFYIESVISVYGGSRRIGDVDPVLGISRIVRFEPPTDNHCSKWDESPADCGMTSIDNWDEFLQQSDSPVVVRSYGNWLARLTLATMSVAQGRTTIVLPLDRHYCWHDVLKFAANLTMEKSSVMRFDANAAVQLQPLVFIQ